MMITSFWTNRNILVELQMLIRSWKHRKLQQSKVLFLYECFDHLNKMQNTEFLDNKDAFYSKFCICNLHEAKDNQYGNLLSSGMSTEQIII